MTETRSYRRARPTAPDRVRCPGSQASVTRSPAFGNSAGEAAGAG